MSKRYRKTSNTPAWVWIVAIILALAFLSSLASNLAIDAPAGGGGGGGNTPSTPGGDNVTHTHVYDRQIKRDATLREAATCTTPAVYYYSCTCGEVSKNATQVFFSGTALGHDFVNGRCSRCDVFSTESCAHEGTKTHYTHYSVFDKSTGGLCGANQHCIATYCFDCLTYVSHGEALDCTYVNELDYDMTCDVCGLRGTSDTHSVTVTYSSTNDGQHTRVVTRCTECGQTPYGTVSGPCVYKDGVCQYCGYINPDYGEHTHVYDQEKAESMYLQIAPDCDSHGFYYYSCLCGEKGTTTFSVPALGHAEVTHAAKAATCTAAGWDAYVTCSRCDYTTYKATAALGHTYANGACIRCQVANPKYEQVDSFASHQPVLNADQTDFTWSGNWTLGDMDANGNYREFNTVHSDTGNTVLKWLIYTVDGVDPYPDALWPISAGYRTYTSAAIGTAKGYDMLIVWTAPEDGTIKLNFSDFNITWTNTSFNFSLYLNGTQVAPSEGYLNIGIDTDLINTDEELLAALGDLTLTVKAGDKLQFRCTRITQGMNQPIYPAVEYQVCAHSETTYDFDGQYVTYTCQSCGAVTERTNQPNASFAIDDSGYTVDLLEEYGFAKGMSWGDFMSQEYSEWLYDANNDFENVLYEGWQGAVGLVPDERGYFVLFYNGAYVDWDEIIVPDATYTLVYVENT